MSHTCKVCSRPAEKCLRDGGACPECDCYRLGYERQKVQADRMESALRRVEAHVEVHSSGVAREVLHIVRAALNGGGK